MLNKTSAHLSRVIAIGALVGAMSLIVFQPSSSVGQAAAPAAAAKKAGPTDAFVKLGFKFDGAQSCSNAQCHGADAPKEGAGATTLAEFTQWSNGDAHQKAYETLTNEDSTAIAGKLKIADATTSARCTSCHALDVPAKLHGKEYSKEEGVSCASCHGPSEKWIGPHKEKGWTDKQRVALKTQEALLAKTGLYDTKSPLARANMCTSCHLAIEADMVAAGHPQPVFELDYFSKGADKGGIYESQHWRDPKTPFYNASLWATGQVVAVRDAMQQLADRAGAKAPNATAVTDAFNQAMAHYSAFKPVVATGVVKGDVKAWDAQAAKIAAGVKAKKWADVAAGAKAVAGEAGKLAPAVGAAKFDKAKTLGVLKALLADTTTPKAYAAQGMEQQAYAIYGLQNSYAGPAGAKTSELIINSLFPPEEGELTADKFIAGLKAVAAQVK